MRDSDGLWLMSMVSPRVAQLGEKYETLLTERVVNGKTWHEVAEAVGVSYSTALWMRDQLAHKVRYPVVKWKKPELVEALCGDCLQRRIVPLRGEIRPLVGVRTGNALARRRITHMNQLEDVYTWNDLERKFGPIRNFGLASWCELEQALEGYRREHDGQGTPGHGGQLQGHSGDKGPGFGGAELGGSAEDGLEVEASRGSGG